MPISGNGSHSPVITIGVFAALAYDVTSANLSSPQTFELNVNQRGPTLHKWLNMNVIEALLWGVGASYFDKTPYPFYGALLGIASMYVKYHYAMASGRRNPKPDMETASGQFGTGGY